MQCVVDSAGTLVVSNVDPCPGWLLFGPAEAGAALGAVTVESLASIGVSAETLATSYLFGFGWVAGSVALAWVVALAVRLIQKL